MKKIQISILFLLISSHILFAVENFSWTELPGLPPLPGSDNQPGLAGAFAGVHNDALIIAGGANFPDGLPWSILPDGGNPQKIYHRDIYILPKGGEWKISDQKLPAGYSYGVSIQLDEGILCIGGEWAKVKDGKSVKVKSNKVYLIKYSGNGDVTIDNQRFPDIPEGISAMAGARIGDYVYIAGGNNGGAEKKYFWRLNLCKKDKWETLKAWPGPPRSCLIAAAQSDGRSECLYIFSGRYQDPEKGWQFLTDSYKYQPDTGIWIRVADVGTNLSNHDPICVMAAPGIAVGANHVAIFGGAPGDLFRKVEQDIPNQIQLLRDAGKTEEANALNARRWDLYENHPGFSRDIWVYHTITNIWAKMGKFPESVIDGRLVGSHVTTSAVEWDGHIIIPNGEVRPGVRSPKIWQATIPSNTKFATSSILILVIYLGGLVLMGIYFSKRENSTDDFFKAGGRIPWWAAGLSIFGTQLSAITFMAIPAKSYATDWTWFVLNMTIVLVAPFIVFLFLPFYRRLNVTTAYEYIEKRFNVILRTLASAMFMIFQFARIGIVLYLPSIALSVVTGVDIWLCTMIMALLSIAYTVMGGIEAVIWTDVIQVIVLLGGATLVLLTIPGHVQNGFMGVVDLARDADKLRMFDFHFSLKGPTFWVLVLGGIGANLISYGSDQSVIQRYLTTRNQKEAARGIWTNAVLTIPASLIFFGLGSALYAFFKSNPETLNISIEMNDAIFPWFIATQLPAGVAGLLIAGIFAAAMSSLDSSMNSVATAFTTDFYKRFKPSAEDHVCLKIARAVTVVVGLCGMCFALAMATWDIQSLWAEFTKYIGLLGGGLGGLFILAIFTRRANSQGAMVGVLGSAIVQYLLQATNAVNGVLFAATGMLSCVILGYVASILMPEKSKDLSGLTLFTLND